MSGAKKTAFAGVFTALCFVFLFIGSIVGTLDLSSAALAGFAIMIALIELGKGYAFGVYAAASVLSAFLLPDKAPAVYFILFSGYYPVVKVFLNRITPKWLSYAARFAVFNTAAAACGFVFVKLLSAEIEASAVTALLLVAANVVFAVYDLALERASVFYAERLRKRIFKGRR